MKTERTQGYPAFVFSPKEVDHYQRFEVAKMLTDKRTYLDISEKTGASTATISRVNRSLNYGNDGYEMVFARMKKDNGEQGGEAE